MAYPFTKRSEVGDTIQQFSDDVGIPNRLRSDITPEITVNHKGFQAKVKRLHMYLTHSEV